MRHISEIDKNFVVNEDIDQPGMRWFDPKLPPFQLHGLIYDDQGYKRMDSDVAGAVNEGVFALHRHTSGGRITFETDSKYIALHVKCGFANSSTMPLTSYVGFDLYLEREDGSLEFTNAFVPPVTINGNYQGIFSFREPGTHKILIHFPLYNTVEALHIGLDGDCVVNFYSPYTSEVPVVYYGSSITQGGCVSRPGNAFPAIASRLSKRDFWCYGFSGSARGEKEMAEYIAAQPMSAFVLDYDHNDCDNRERLAKQHPMFYRTIRESHPDIPIIMTAPYAARPFYDDHPRQSKEILRKTYENAKAAGDWVYFIDCGSLFGEDKDAALVDRIHPGDVGHLKMAHAVLDCLKDIEKRRSQAFRKE